MASNYDQLAMLVKALLDLPQRSRGRVMVRQLLSLRHTQFTPQGFPVGREFRVFLWGQTVLGWSYYWDFCDPLAELSEPERVVVLDLAKETQRRLEVPFLAVDIGQDGDGRWWVIETGDPQFSGLAQLAPLRFWKEMQVLSLQD